MDQVSIALIWKLRRVAARWRLLDLYLKTGITTTRLSLIEQGRRAPTKLEARVIEQALPPLPHLAPNRKAKRDQDGMPAARDIANVS